MAADEIFTEGFDKYGIVGAPNLPNILLMGEWTSAANPGNGFSIQAPLSGDGSGYSLRLFQSGGGTVSLTKQLSGNYARVSGGVTFKILGLTSSQQLGLNFMDGSTSQFSVRLNDTGTFSLIRGDEKSGTVLATSLSGPSIGTINCLEWDIVCHGSTGTATFYLNSVAVGGITGLTGLDLTSTANNYFNRIMWKNQGSGGAVGTNVELDHMYCFFFSNAADPDAGCLLTNPVIDTDFAADDYDVDFDLDLGTIGDLTRYGTNVASPAAGSLILRKFTAVGDGALTAMAMLPNATSGTAKFKGVIYADNGSGTAPTGAPLDTGAEVVGCTSGTALSSDMNDIALTDGTVYWIGFIMDTSLSLQLSDGNSIGYRAANTYASGAPNPAPAMTSGQGSWYLYGVVAPDEGWSQLRQNPPSSLSYISGDAAGERSIHGFDALTVTPAQIHCAAYKSNTRRTDAGARTVKVVAESAGIEASGPTVAPSTSGTWIVGYFTEDPDTGLPWNAADLQAGHGGIEIVS